MGLLKAVHGAVGSVLEEQWKEFYLCDELSDNTLLVPGHKLVGKRSANTRTDDNVLTNGSVLSVADGQCVLVVKQGKVIDFCREPGEHIFEDPEQAGLKGFFQEVGRRVAFGGGDIQPVIYRVYYLNVKEIMGIPFRTPSPVPFLVCDKQSGLDLDSGVMVSGCFSCRVSDPILLYKSLIGNVSRRFTRDAVNTQMQAELVSSLQPALEALSRQHIAPHRLSEQVPALEEALRRQMNEGWCGQHGLELGSFALDSCRVVDQKTVQHAQFTTILKDPATAAAAVTGAAAQAMTAAAMGKGAVPVMAVPKTIPGTPWKCSCGTTSDRKFCPECGRPRPTSWRCSCGQLNNSRFCQICGAKKPAQ